MKIAGIDPGVTTGFAILDTSTNTFTRTEDHRDPLRLGRLIIRLHKSGQLDIAVIEDFVGSGRRNEFIVVTIKNLGFFEGVCALYKIPHKLQTPQYRRAFLEDADRMTPPGHHFKDAGAHCLAAAHRLRREGKL